MLPLSDWGFNKYGTTLDVSVGKKLRKEWGHAISGGYSQSYNCNGNLNKTLLAFREIANNRYDLYKYTDDDSTKINYKGVYDRYELQNIVSKNTYRYGERMSRFCISNSISVGLYPKNGIYELEVECFSLQQTQCPAFIMTFLASLASQKYHQYTLGSGVITNNSIKKIDSIGFINKYKENSKKERVKFSLAEIYNTKTYKIYDDQIWADRYNDSFWEFLHSCIDTVDPLGTSHLGGMVHGHTPETYYIIADADNYTN
jgi:hypothetical protein